MKPYECPECHSEGMVVKYRHKAQEAGRTVKVVVQYECPNQHMWARLLG